MTNKRKTDRVKRPPLCCPICGWSLEFKYKYGKEHGVLYGANGYECEPCGKRFLYRKSEFIREIGMKRPVESYLRKPKPPREGLIPGAKFIAGRDQSGSK